MQRESLVTSLLACGRPLVLVVAPAGYGKTIALSQWVASDPRTTAWLQIDEADNDPVVLLAYLALTLGDIAGLDPGVLDLLSRRTPHIDDQVLPAIAAAMSQAPPFLLVLDDCHLLQDETCWRLLATLLDQLPDGAQICIGSRTEPPLPLGRLRAAGTLAEYGQSDLAFDRREIDSLLRLRGLELASAGLDRLRTATEGWPAGLSLSLLADSQGGRSVTERSVTEVNVRGDHRAIASYLTEEVLERQSESMRRFLLRTSILDRLSAEVCRAVTGDDRAGERLAKAAHDNLFVAALDDHGEWFRYHHLFAELLAAVELRRAPEEIPGLHRRAAEWFWANGAPERAVRHWLAAGDVEEAAWPAYCSCQMLVDAGQTESARLMLDLFSDEQLSQHFALTMAAAWLYGTVIGDPVKGERWCRAACSAPVGDELVPDGTGTWRGSQAGLRAFLAPEGLARMLTDAELCLECVRQDGPATAEGHRVLGVAAYLNGQARRAERCFREVLAACDEPLFQAYALAFLSLIASDEGRHDDARDLDAKARSLAPEMGLDLSPGMFTALPQLLAHVRVLARDGDLETDAFLKKIERHHADMVPQVAWRLLLIHTVLGEVQSSRGEAAEAERWCRRAEALLATESDAGMLAGRVKRLRAVLEQQRMAEPLTAAERRVLDLLPTQLTADQMAARLFLSRNTVKSHMSHVYRKLGVTSRTEAVETARRLGLL